MAITRADIAGALKLLNANNIANRRGHLQNMAAAEHPPLEVTKILSDLESYKLWAPRMDLEAAPAPETGASAVPIAAPVPSNDHSGGL